MEKTLKKISLKFTKLKTGENTHKGIQYGAHHEGRICFALLSFFCFCVSNILPFTQDTVVENIGRASTVPKLSVLNFDFSPRLDWLFPKHNTGLYTEHYSYTHSLHCRDHTSALEKNRRGNVCLYVNERCCVDAQVVERYDPVHPVAGDFNHCNQMNSPPKYRGETPLLTW